jgi:hypothetical protein
MSKRWWDDPDHKQKYWGEADWRDWEKHGRPAIPREARLGSDAPLPLDGLPVVQPAHTLGGFTLHPKKSTARNARSRGVDKLLDSLGVQPTRRAR